MKKAFAIIVVFSFQLAMFGQGVPAASADTPRLRVCCRPLPRWHSSRNPLLFALNRSIVTHLHHCYIDFGETTVLPEFGGSVQTSGIHPILSDNNDKQPIPDQITDTLIGGGECRNVEGATPEKIARLRDELAAGTCNSCASHYHNRVITFCFNNSNTYVYDLISDAGMKPPKMTGAPGYRSHHACVKEERQRSQK
jgi:hypothetical protein